ncbi:MAG: biosynthetic peptidoglycan transglycosylase [Acidimicrobiales bacterium]
MFEALPSTVYDAAGNKLAVCSPDFDLTAPMKPEDVPDVLKLAVVAAEDQRFYEHHGVDLQGVARAAWVSYQGGEILQGGSTITQQYIKNAYLNFDEVLPQALREALLATQLERQMTKDEILFNYLNTIYFGAGAHGAAAAAQSYFQAASQLNLSEAATLRPA